MDKDANRPADDAPKPDATERLSQEQLDALGRFHADVKGATNIVEAADRLSKQLAMIQEERAKEVPAYSAATEQHARYATLMKRPEHLLARKGYSMDVESKAGSEKPALLVEPTTDIGGKTREDMAQYSPYELAIKQTGFECKLLHEYYRVSSLITGKRYDGIQSLDTFQKLRGLIELSTHWDRTAGDGLEWVPTLSSSMLVDFFQLEPVIATQFSANYTTIPRGTGNYTIPVDTSGVTWDVIRSAAVSQGFQSALLAAAVGPNSGQVVLSPALMRGGITLDMDMEEDAALDVLASGRRAIQRDGALAWDDAILNGQATVDDANHDGTNATEPADGAYNGLRFYAHQTNVNETNLLGAIFESNDVKAMRAGMRKFAVNPTRLRLLMSPAAYLTLVHDTTDQNVTTVEKYGAAATIATGEVARVWGIPVIPTDRMAENMNATGDTATTGVFTGVILVNVDRWYPGIKRQMELRMVPSPAHDQMGMYGFTRTALDSAPPDTDDHTWYTFNVALS